MKKKNKYIDLGQLPTDGEWMIAYEAMMKEIKEKRGEDPLLEVDKVDLHDFLDGVFFLLWQIGIKRIKNIEKICHFFKEMFNTNNINHKDFYLEEFEWDWFNGDRESHTTGEEYFYSCLSEAMYYVVGRGSCDCDRGDILYLGYTDEIAFKHWKAVEWRMLNMSLPKLKLENNQKYLPAIFSVAKDLTEWMYKNN